MKLMEFGKIDLKDSDAVKQRLGEFFKLHADNDMKPTVAGMAMALGVDRRRLWEIKTGNLKGGLSESNLPPVTLDSIKKAYLLMENL
jgi:hypothetical protein